VSRIGVADTDGFESAEDAVLRRALICDRSAMTNSLPSIEFLGGQGCRPAVQTTSPSTASWNSAENMRRAIRGPSRQLPEMRSKFAAQVGKSFGPRGGRHAGIRRAYDLSGSAKQQSQVVSHHGG